MIFVQTLTILSYQPHIPVQSDIKAPMLRERITETLYVFTSELYVQVTASVILTSEGAVLVDTLLYPEETHQIKRFVQDYLKRPITHLILTHHHADHTMGACLWPHAQIIAHERCRDLLDARGRRSLAQLQERDPQMANMQIMLPTRTFRDRLVLTVGDRTLTLWATPGHSTDSVVCLVAEERVLIAADTVMPVPHFVDGSHTDLLQSLQALKRNAARYDAVVQGHGEVLLRGEIQQRLQEDIAYLQQLDSVISQRIGQSAPQRDHTAGANRLNADVLQDVSPEDCGKSRVLLNGAAMSLHRQNALSLAASRRKQQLPID